MGKFEAVAGEHGDPPVPADEYLERVFGEGGLLAQAFPGYQVRPGQLQLTEATHKSFDLRENLLAEAPTGTGKSLAYGVPAVWWASLENPERSALGRERSRVLIVTANIALQEQLHENDLPKLAGILPWKFTHALMKGRDNYLCLSQLNDLPINKAMLMNQLDRRKVDEIERWASVTTTGDVNELPFELKDPKNATVRQLVVIGQDDCLGKKCPHHSDCYAENAKKRAKTADIVVTNYHMFCIDLKVRSDTGGEAGVLPEYDIVVFDEAHKMADIARDFFGTRVTVGGLKKTASILWADATPKKGEVHLDKTLRDNIADAASRFFELLEAHYRSPEYKARIRVPDIADCVEICELLREGSTCLGNALASGVWDDHRSAEMGRAADKLSKYATAIEHAMTLAGGDEGWVYFIEQHGAKSIALISKPLSVAEFLRPLVWDSKNIRSAVATSATLTTDGKDDFFFFSTEVGAEAADELVAESPFDWREQCEVVVPPTICEPSAPGFAADVAKHMLQVATATDGSMLGLFTSYRVLEATHKKFIEAGWADRVMRQNDQPRMQLIARLKADPGMVLLGTESFWAGVDVPGDALQVVCIDRLPFPSPEDPMLSAYEALNGRQTFKKYSMPRALVGFRQGFGRLIRSVNDCGVVVVMDRRLMESGYGKSFQRALPAGLQFSRDLIGALKRKVRDRNPVERGSEW